LFSKYGRASRVGRDLFVGGMDGAVDFDNHSSLEAREVDDEVP
jgi:hypothetical protein